MDVCVVGHITKDLIRIPGKTDRELAGGSAYYVSVALKSLGLDVTVVTNVARADEERLLSGLTTRGIRVVNGSTSTTTVFENAYTDATLARRHQWVRSVAEPIHPRTLAGIRARAFHVGPLTSAEISPELLEDIRGRAPLVALDAQGMLREVRDEKVELGRWREVERALPLVDVLKVDDAEATTLTDFPEIGEAAQALGRLGVREVLLTLADRGSVLQNDGQTTHIDAVQPDAIVDATGCGDTYAAGYLFARLAGEAPAAAAAFAAAVASKKLEGYGPFEGTAAEVRRHLARARAR